MFRLKISLTHAVLVGLLIGAVHLFLGGGLTQELDHRAEVSLRRAAVIAEQTKRVDHFALQEKGRVVANDAEIHDFLTLDREKLLTKIKDENAWILTSDVGKKLGDEAKKAADSSGENLSTNDLRHLAVDFRLRVARKRFENIEKDIDKEARNLDQSLVGRQPVRPDMVMALNKNGVGVAALGRDRYSWGSSSNSPNVADKHTIVQKVIDNPDAGPRLDVWEWQWGSGDDPSLYQVAIIPVKPADVGEASGVIVVGNTIHDGAAKEIQKLVGGLTVGGANEQHVDVEDVQAAPDIAFFHGERIHSSTFGSTQQKRLGETLFEEIKILEEDNPEEMVQMAIAETPYIGFVRFFPGQFETPKPTGIVVMSNMNDVTAPVQQILKQFDMIALAVIVLGIILLLFFYQRFIKPVAEIEESIGEILSGNKEAEFVISRDHPVFSSLAQGLNLMSAYLQGKPMPDDEAELEGWGDLVGGGGGGSSDDDGGGGGGSPQVTGVQMPGMGGGGGDSDDETED